MARFSVTSTSKSPTHLEVRAIELELEGDLDSAKLMGKDVETRAGYDGIRMTVRVQSDASNSALEEVLAEVERRCPVSDNLRNPTPVALELARA